MSHANYPTKETIMETPQLHKPTVIRAVRDWKRTMWYPVRQEGPGPKFEALSSLAQNIAQLYQKPVNVEYAPELPSCMYRPMTHTIYINASLSIISTLHELAHHLFGADETKACRWSIWLFKKTFKKSFDTLEWQGHMLIKK
jgi:hypothetical protein